MPDDGTEVGILPEDDPRMNDPGADDPKISDPVPKPQPKRRGRGKARKAEAQPPVDEQLAPPVDKKSTAPPPFGKPDGEEESFDEWMARLIPLIKPRPTGSYRFAIDRKYPLTDDEGNPCAGVQRYTARPFSFNWLCSLFPDGAEISVYVQRHPNSTDAQLAGLWSNWIVKHKIMIPRRHDESVEPHPWDRHDEDEGEDEDEKQTLVSGDSAIAGSLTERVLSSFIDQAQRTQEKYETMIERQVRRPPMPPTPPPAPTQPPEDKAQAQILDKLVDAFTSSHNDGQSERSQDEINRVHRHLSDLQKAHASEMADRLERKDKETAERLQEQAGRFEERIRHVETRADEKIDRASSDKEVAISAARERGQDKYDALKDRFDDVKEDKNKLEVKLDATDKELADLRGKVSTLQASKEALEATKGMEITTAVITAEAKIRKEVEAERPKKSSDDDELGAIGKLLKSLKSAKELSSELSTELGTGQSEPTAPKESMFDKLLKTGTEIIKDSDVRSFAKDITKSAAEGLKDLNKSRAESKEIIRRATVPSTEAIAAAWTNNPDPKVMPPSTVRVVEPQQAPQVVADTTATDVTDVASDLKEKVGEVERLEAAALEMLDEVELLALEGAPVEEGADKLVEKMSELLGQPRDAIVPHLEGATAAGTLQELDLPPNHLSEGAKTYMDEILSHVTKKASTTDG